MEDLGYGEQPYIVFKHSDIAREHIHIVSLRVDSEGRKINDQFERRRSKRITDALELKYGLIPSSRLENKPLEIAPSLEGLVDETPPLGGWGANRIEEVMRFVLKHYAFQSLGELNALLANYQLTAEEVKREFRDKQYDGVVYMPIDDKGNKIGTPIPPRKWGVEWL